MAHLANAAVAAAKREPIFLPGFDRHTQLAMEFATLTFGSAWLRRTFTNECDASVQARLTAVEHSSRDRRLAEVRYGNNITVLLKACYCLRDFHGSDSLWIAISRAYGVKPDVAYSVADLFVEARAKYRSNYSAARDTSPLITEATHWADKWASFLDERKEPSPASDSEVFATAYKFFREENSKNGDLACILSKSAAMDPPSAPRALRKRSPSPSPLQGTPIAKRISKGTDDPMCGSPPGRARTASLGAGAQLPSRPTHEPHETTPGTDARQYQNDEVRRKIQQEPHFELKIRGQAQRDNRISPSHQDRPWPEADEYEALAQSNIELQGRVDFLEKERVQASRAQKDRDDAIRTLQTRFATFEKTSAAVDAQSSVNDKLIQEMKEMVKKLGTQAERLQQLEKQLELRDQAAQRMQTTITSLQKKGATQPRPSNGQAGVAATETKTGGEGAPATLSEEVSEMHIKIKSLEAKSVFFNDLHKNVREIKADISAQKDRATVATPDPADEENHRATSTKLRAIEEGMERQVQTVQGMIDRVVVLEDQATLRNTRIASLESRPDTAKEISQLHSRLSTVENNQIVETKTQLDKYAAIWKSVEASQKSITQFTEMLGDTVRAPTIEAIAERLSGMQTRIAKAEEHGTETTKRLDDMEVSHDALTLHDQSSRIDELSQSLESLKVLLLGVARNDDIETLRAEFKSLSEQQAVAGQSMYQSEDLLASVSSICQNLSNRMTRLDDMYENYATERHERPDQPLHANGNVLHDGKQNNVSAVIESLCKRVSVMENGFQIMRDAMLSGRRR